MRTVTTHLPVYFVIKVIALVTKLLETSIYDKQFLLHIQFKFK